MAYDLKEDHALLKQHIKKWELELDGIIAKYSEANKGNQFEPLVNQISDELEGISQEMMSINI